MRGDELSKIFIANRGEIALRIIKACKESGMEFVMEQAYSGKRTERTGE